MDFKPGLSRGLSWLSVLAMAGALTFGSSFQAMSQSLPLEVEIDIAMAALEQAMNAENHAETLAQIDLIRDLDPDLTSGELLFFEALAAKATGDIPRADAALVRFLSDVGQQSASYDDALAMALELRAIKAETTALDEGVAAFDAEDYADALRILHPLAKAGEAEAQYYLGEMYSNGLGIAQDHEEAVRWYRLAAEQDHPGGLVGLGYHYRYGDGVEEDVDEGVRLHRAAADQGDPRGLIALGGYYYWGDAKDYAEAARLYRAAAEQGDPYGQVLLGRMHKDGEGVDRDPAEAMRWYQRAIDQGYVLGMTHLGDMYAEGAGIPMNAEEALRLYHMAAKQDPERGWHAIGQMYLYGHAVRRNPDEARDWLTRSDAAGDLFSPHWIESNDRLALTSDDWLVRRADATCYIYSIATDVTPEGIITPPFMEFRAWTRESGDQLTSMMVSPNPFRIDKPIVADVDGARFDLEGQDWSIYRGTSVRPASPAVIRAIRAGEAVTITGTSIVTDQPLSATFSAAGFTRAFTTMAELCDRPGILSLIR
ncbi:MAG: tetratricopeptide repeat protein [Devosia sp.]